VGGAWFAVGSNVNNQKKKRGENAIVLSLYTQGVHDLIYFGRFCGCFPCLLKWKSL
jgi:hypothetical protein